MDREAEARVLVLVLLQQLGVGEVLVAVEAGAGAHIQIMSGGVVIGPLVVDFIQLASHQLRVKVVFKLAVSEF